MLNIADEVRCAICYDTMVYAHTTQCSHSFCGMCIFDCLIKVHAPRPRPTMIPHGGCDARLWQSHLCRAVLRLAQASGSTRNQHPLSRKSRLARPLWTKPLTPPARAGRVASVARRGQVPLYIYACQSPPALL